MKNFFNKYSKATIIGIIIGLLLSVGLTAYAQNSSFFLLQGTQITPVSPAWGFKIPKLGTVGGAIVSVDSLGNFGTTTGGGSASQWVNSVNSGIYYSNGIVDVGSSTANASGNDQGSFNVYDEGALGAGMTIHTLNDAPWALRIFNDTYSVSQPVFDYYGYNTGEFEMGTEDSKPLFVGVGGYQNIVAGFFPSNSGTNGEVQIGGIGVMSENTLRGTEFAVVGTSTLINGVALEISNSNDAALDDFLNNGFVGIGSSTPFATLSVVPKVLGNPAFEVANKGVGGFYVKQLNAINLPTSIINVGIGTSSPPADFTLAAASTTNPVNLSTRTGLIEIIGGFENTLFQAFEVVDEWGHNYFHGDATTLNSCTGGSIMSTSNDNAGQVTVGTGLTSCGVLFAHPYASGALLHVSLNEDSGTIVSADAQSVSTTGFTITSLSVLTGDVFSYTVEATY